MAQPPRKRSLEEIFGAPAPAAPAASRPSLEQIFGKPPEEEPGFLSKAYAGVKGVLDTPGSVLMQTAARLAGIGESEETKRQYQQYVETARSKLGPQGKARQTYELARDITSFPVEIGKYAAVASIPGFGIPLAAALGAGESAGGLKEESSAALAQSLLQKGGAERAASALTPVIESGFGRAAFDVGLGEAMALGVRGGVKAYRAVKGRAPTAPVENIADAPPEVQKLLTAGAYRMPSSTDNLAWQQARIEELMRRTREQVARAKELETGRIEAMRQQPPITDPRRLLTAQASQTLEPGTAIPMGGAGSTTGPYFPPPPERPFIQVGQSRPRRIPAPGQALPPEGVVPLATPEDIARALRRSAAARAERQSPEVTGLTPEREAMQRALDEAEALRRGGEPPPELADVPATRLDEALYPDGSVRLSDAESRDVTLVDREAGQPRVPTASKSLSKLSVRQMQAMRNRALMRVEEATADEDWFNTFGMEISEAGGGSGRSGNRFNQYGEKVVDKGKTKVSPARLRIDGAYTEDELGYAMERFGLDPQQYHEQVVRAQSAAKRSSTARAELERLDAEMKRRGYDPASLENRPDVTPAGPGEEKFGELVQPQEPVQLQRARTAAAVEGPPTGAAAKTTPRRLYHGSPDPTLTTFDRLAPRELKSKPDRVDSVGTWFAESAEDATPFTSGFNAEGKPVKGRAYQADVEINNPKEYASWDELLDDFNTANNRPEWVGRSRLPEGAPYSVRGVAPDGGNIFNDYLRQQGYDGIKVTQKGGIDRKADTQTYWVALEPEKQAKITPESARELGATVETPPTRAAAAVEPPAARAVEAPSAPTATPGFVPLRRPESGPMLSRAPDFRESGEYVINIPGAENYRLMRDRVKGDNSWLLIDNNTKDASTGIQELAAWNRVDAEKSALEFINRARELGGVTDPANYRFVPYETTPPGRFAQEPYLLTKMSRDTRNAVLERMSPEELQSVQSYAQQKLDDLFTIHGGVKPIERYPPRVQDEIKKFVNLLGATGVNIDMPKAPAAGRPRTGTVERFLSEESGAIDPRVMGQIATTALGAAGGAAVSAQQEDLGGTPLQRALTGAIAGGSLAAGASYGATRMLRGRGATAPRGSTPALQFINEGINVGARETREAERLLSRFERFKTALVSETLPLERAAEVGGGAGKRKTVSELIAQQQGAGQSAKQFLRDRLGPVIESLTDAEMDDVRALIKARRLVNIVDKGGATKAAGTYQQWAQAVRDGNANPRVKSAADAVNQMHRDLLAMRKDAGLLTDEQYKAILNSDDFYTPFVREIAEDLTDSIKLTLPGSKAGRFNVFTSGVKKMDRDVESLANTADPLEVAAAAAARAFRDTRKQEVMNTLMDLADAGALPFVRQVKADPTKPLGASQFQQIRGGKTRVYEVDDPDLFRAMAGQDARSRNFMVRMAQALKAIKTYGVTLNPAFTAFNVIRDVAASGIQRPDVQRAFREAAMGSGAGGVIGAGAGAALDPEQRDLESLTKNFLKGAGVGAGIGMYTRPMLETLQAASMIIGNDNLYKDFLRQGGSTESFFVRNPDDAQKVIRELRRQKVDLKTIVNPKSWVDALKFIGNVGEQSTRLAAYKQMRDAGKTPLEAIINAQDRTLRFANVGADTKTLASMTPFWNAKVQGWDKLLRLAFSKETRGKTAALAGTMITAPTVALWFVNKDNPEYWARPQWERNLFWLVPIPGREDFLRVPKPFEIGYMFASVPERLLDYAAQRGAIESAATQSAEPGRALTRAVSDMASSTMEGTVPVPQILSTALQYQQGRDWFRNRDIVTRPDLPEVMQGSRETSALARSMAEAGIAPEKTDFVVRDLFGTAGEEGLKLSSSVARAMGANVPESDQPAPITGLFARRFLTQERGQSEPEVAARDRLRELAKVQAGLRETEKGGDEGAIMQYMEKNLPALDLYNELKPLQDMLDDEVAMRRQVERDTRLTNEERRAMLSDIRQRTINISRAILETKGNNP